MKYIEKNRKDPYRTSCYAISELGLSWLNIIIIKLEFKIIVLTQCKRTGSCYNELVVAFFSTCGGLIVCLFVWFLTTHQPLWVISVRRYQTKHDEDGKSKNL